MGGYMLFKIGLDVLNIDSDAVRYALREAYDKDQYDVESYMRPPINDSQSELEFKNRGLELATHVRNKSRDGTRIFIGLTGGTMLYPMKNFGVRLDYMVVVGLLKRPFRGCLNRDFDQQLKQVKCSPSMAPESIERFLQVVTVATKLIE